MRPQEFRFIRYTATEMLAHLPIPQMMFKIIMEITLGNYPRIIPDHNHKAASLRGKAAASQFPRAEGIDHEQFGCYRL